MILLAANTIVDNWVVMSGISVIIFQSGILYHKVSRLEQDVERLSKKVGGR